MECCNVKGEIVAIEKIFDSSSCQWFYQAIIDFEELPKLKLGECKVIQK
jgi:hypothetical protein